MEDWGFLVDEHQDQIADQKVWVWGIKKENGELSYYSKPYQMEFSSEQLKNFRFGQKPVIELIVMHNDSILYLFNDSQSATTFMEGFKTGLVVGEDQDEFWNKKIGQWEEAKKNAPEFKI